MVRPTDQATAGGASDLPNRSKRDRQPLCGPAVGPADGRSAESACRAAMSRGSGVTWSRPRTTVVRLGSSRSRRRPVGRATARLVPLSHRRSGAVQPPPRRSHGPPSADGPGPGSAASSHRRRSAGARSKIRAKSRERVSSAASVEDRSGALTAARSQSRSRSDGPLHGPSATAFTMTRYSAPEI